MTTMISDDALRAMIDAVIGEIDYDLAKELDPETSEFPTDVDELWDRLLRVTRHAFDEHMGHN